MIKLGNLQKLLTSIFSLTVSLFLFTLIPTKAYAQDSYIIVHVLNPEGIEIASIQGMAQNSVEIYDGDTLIGYGAYDPQTYNKPIAISSGAHTIKAKFNGMTKEQTITLNPRETRNLIFTFERRVWDFLTFLNGIGHVREERYFNHRMLSAFEAEFLSYPPYPSKFIHTNVGLHAESWQNTSITGALYGDVTITSNTMDIDLGVINPWSDADSWDLGMRWGYYIAEIDEFISNLPGFTNWYIQNEPTSNVGGNASFSPIAAPQLFIANTSDYRVNTISIHSLRGINIVIYRSWWNDFYVYNSKGEWYHKTYHEIFTHDKVYISSVAYDILGTGIKYEPAEPLSIPYDKQAPLKDTTTVAEPINVANGNMFTSVTDISIPSSALPLELSRTYNSQDDFSGSFGYGWRSNFDITLTEQPDSSVIEVDQDGVYTIYAKQPDGSYTPSAGKYSTLVKNSDSTFTLTRKYGQKLFFNSSGLLTKIEDRNANSLNIMRDATDIIQEVSDSFGRKLQFISDAEGKMIEVRDSANRSFKYEHDSNGNLVKTIDPLNNQTLYSYDANHNLTSTTDANNHSLFFEYDSFDRAYHSWQDNQNNEVTLSFDPANKTTISTDSLGNATKYGYNTYGLVTKITDSQGNTQSFIWDDSLNKTSSTDKNNNITFFTYDTQGNLISLKDPLNNVTTFTYTSDFNQLSSTTDAQANTTEYTYDFKGNLIQTKDALNNITTYTYNALGQLLQTKDANNNITSFSYDTFGNLTKTTDALNNATLFAYDAIGNLIQTTDAQDNAAQFSYDLLNRLTRITYPDASKVIYTYDPVGNLISFTDPNNNTTTYSYDVTNRLIQTTDALGNSTQYAYNTEGNRTVITDANQNKTQYFYDSLNRLIKTTDPLNHQTLFNYDSNGNLIAKTNSNSNSINYTYDVLNRLIKKQFPDSTAAAFSYDAKGNLLTADNQNISYNYTYNPLGQLIKVKDSNNRSLTYAYDALGNKIQMTSPEDKTTNYTYDVLNRLNSILDIYGNTTAYSYDSLGRRINTQLPNGTKASYTYDSLNNLLTLANKTSNDEIISSYSYEYDKAGNRLSMKGLPPKGTVPTVSYTYDALYRLTKALSDKSKKDKLSENYTYDSLGNRLNSLKDSYTYNSLNQLLTSQKYTYQYDANGNLIQKTEIDEGDGKTKTTTFAYDFENRLIQVLIKKADEIKSVSFKYDPFGRRIEKKTEEQEEGKIESKTTTYIYDNEDIILEYIVKTEDGGTKTETTRYTHGSGIDEPISIEQGAAPKIYYYHYDGLGSVTSLTDEKQKIAESYKYDSFGNLKRHGNKTKNRFTYTGREYDKEAELYYYRNRYYDPKVGRFITADPLGFIDGPNPYIYVNNNPINWVDPWGLSTVEVGYKKIIGVGDLAIWHTFIKVTYQGQTKMRGFNATNIIQIPFTLLRVDIPGKVSQENEKGAVFAKIKIMDSAQAMIVYNLVDSKQFAWNNYNYINKNCFDWVDAVLLSAGIIATADLPWSGH